MSSISPSGLRHFPTDEAWGSYPEAHEVAIRLFEERKAQLARKGLLDLSDVAAVTEVRKATVPP